MRRALSVPVLPELEVCSKTRITIAHPPTRPPTHPPHPTLLHHDLHPKGELPPKIKKEGPTRERVIFFTCAGVVEAQIEQDRVAALRRELAELEAQLARAQRLLAIADPDG